MKLWIAGGRDFDDDGWVKRATIPYVRDEWHLITGGQRKWHKAKGRWVGADHQAENLWRNTGLPYQGVPAAWRKRGQSAGPIRNEDIAANYSPDHLLLFPGGSGTGHARAMAKKYGIPFAEADPALRTVPP